MTHENFVSSTPHESAPKIEVERATLQEAREILGEDTLGPEEIEKAFGFQPPEVPPLPYSRKDLEQAKELGEMLVLRTDKDVEGQPLTMKRLEEIMTPRLQQVGQRKIYWDTLTWFRKEDFFTKDTPKPEWRLVSKGPIPRTGSRDYIYQTQSIRNYLQQNGLLTPSELAECSDAKLEELRTLMKSDRRAAAKQLSELAINQNHLRTPVESTYDLLACLGAKGERWHERQWEWTSRLCSNDQLAYVGRLEVDGLSADSCPPDERFDGLCAYSSR